MSDSRKYVFGAALASAALGGISDLIQRAHADTGTNAQFTFENVNATYFPSGTSAQTTRVTTGGVTVTQTTGTATTFGSFNSSAIGPILADAGTGSAYGVHAAGTTVWSTPSGNGSTHALSGNVWAANDYYEFDVPTSGIQNIVLSFDQTGSNTGPRDFALIGIDGTGSSTFTITTLYTLSNGNWSVSTTNTGNHYAFSLTDPTYTAFNNNSSVIFRLVDLDATNITGGAVGTAGSDRVDNFVVSGDLISSPEPATLSLFGAASAFVLLGRKRRTRPIRRS